MGFSLKFQHSGRQRQEGIQSEVSLRPAWILYDLARPCLKFKKYTLPSFNPQHLVLQNKKRRESFFLFLICPRVSLHEHRGLYPWEAFQGLPRCTKPHLSWLLYTEWAPAWEPSLMPILLMTHPASAGMSPLRLLSEAPYWKIALPIPPQLLSFLSPFLQVPFSSSWSSMFTKSFST